MNLFSVCTDTLMMVNERAFTVLQILDDVFATQMQRLQGRALQEKDLEPPRSVAEARSMLSRDAHNGTDSSSLFFY